jgi:protein gp37
MNLATGQYWDQSYSPIRGCSHASPGCDHCWAERIAGRFCRCQCDKSPKAPTEENPDPFFGFATPAGWTGRVELIESGLLKPLHWKKPRIVAQNWMGDLFHPSVPDKAIDRVAAIWALTPHLKHLVLTKRAKRMREYWSKRDRHNDIELAADRIQPGGGNPSFGGMHLLPSLPLPNVALGVSVEDQQRADERIPYLLQTPAAMRWVSIEPMLGAVTGFQVRNLGPAKIDWVVLGGESGPGARPMHPASARGVCDQCAAAGVPFFFKQWGEWTPDQPTDYHRVSGRRYSHETFAWGKDGKAYNPVNPAPDDFPKMMFRVGKKAAGRLLDGRTWDQLPGWLQ